MSLPTSSAATVTSSVRIASSSTPSRCSAAARSLVGVAAQRFPAATAVSSTSSRALAVFRVPFVTVPLPRSGAGSDSRMESAHRWLLSSAGSVSEALVNTDVGSLRSWTAQAAGVGEPTSATASR